VAQRAVVHRNHARSCRLRTSLWYGSSQTGVCQQVAAAQALGLTLRICANISLPLQPGRSQSSKSCSVPQTHSVPLTPELPPRNLPRLSLTWRLLIPAMGAVTRFQSVSASKFLLQPPVILMFSLSLQSGPASISKMRALASSASRPATTQPLVPPPLTDVSYDLYSTGHTLSPDNVIVLSLYHSSVLRRKYVPEWIG